MFWRRKDDIVRMLTQVGKAKETQQHQQQQNNDGWEQIKNDITGGGGLNRFSDVSILILKRDAKAAWESLLLARATRMWIGGHRQRWNAERKEQGQEKAAGGNKNSIIFNMKIENGDGANDATAAINEKSSSSPSISSSETTYRQKQGKEESEKDKELRLLYKTIIERNGGSGNARFTSVQDYSRHYRYFVESKERYDEAVENVLKELQIPYDVLDYDMIRYMPVVAAHNNRCWISNCNFNIDEQRRYAAYLGVKMNVDER